MSPLRKDKTRRNSSLAFITRMSLYRDQNRVYVFLYIVFLAVRMVADVTETRYIIPSLEFKTWTKKF